MKNRRVVVSIGDARTAEPFGRPRDILGARALGQNVILAGLADVPVLAELAAQIAAAGSERQHRRSRQEMIERFLFHRIDAEAA